MMSIFSKSFAEQALRRILFLLPLLLVLPLTSYSQSRQELEKQRLQLQKEIQEINTLLFKSQKKEKTLLSDLSDLVKRIGVRTELIKTIDEETRQLNFEIEENEKQVAMLQDRLEILKKDYANMVVQSYKSKANTAKALFSKGCPAKRDNYCSIFL